MKATKQSARDLANKIYIALEQLGFSKTNVQITYIDNLEKDTQQLHVVITL